MRSFWSDRSYWAANSTRLSLSSEYWQLSDARETLVLSPILIASTAVAQLIALDFPAGPKSKVEVDRPATVRFTPVLTSYRSPQMISSKSHRTDRLFNILVL